MHSQCERRRDEEWEALREEELPRLLSYLKESLEQVSTSLFSEESAVKSRELEKGSPQPVAKKMTLDDILASARRTSSSPGRRGLADLGATPEKKAPKPSRPAGQMVSYESPERDLKGFFVLDGAFLVDAEIECRKGTTLRSSSLSSSRETASMRFQVLAGSPYVLSQLQAAFNLSDSLLHRVNAFDASGDLQCGTLESFLKEWLECLTEARAQLRGPHPAPFPQPLVEPHVFTPPLPAEVAIQFTVEDASVVCRAYVIRAVATKQRPGAALSVDAPASGPALAGQVYWKRGLALHLLRVIEARAHIESLKEVQTKLHQCHALVSALRLKCVQLKGVR